MNRTSIHHSLLVLSVAMATAWPLSPAVADKGWPHEDVHPKFGLMSRADGPFPADRFTVEDRAQNTCERINLPKPDCTILPDGRTPSACMEVKLLNELDGFNTRPRIAIPFDGKIDLGTVNKKTIFLVSLGDAMIDGVPGCPSARVETDEEETLPRPHAGSVVGIDQGVWDAATNTLYVEAAETLEQHTRYAVFVTRGVKDKNGEPIEAPKAFKKAIGDDEEDTAVDPAIAAYEATLRRAVEQAHFFGVKRHDIAVASVFTTLSVTAALEKVWTHVMFSTPPPSPADFNIAKDSNGNTRPAVFDLSKIANRGVTYHREVQVNAAPSDNTFGQAFLDAMRIIPGAIKTLAFGRIQTPNYLQADASMISFATYSGSPIQLGTSDLYFELMLPSEDLNATPERRKPPGGWPVVIWGHANNETGVNGSQNRVAAVFAKYGIATLSWNQIGYGFGPNSTVTIAQTAGPSLTFPFAGRTYDINHPDIQPHASGPDGFYDGSSAQPEGAWGVRDPSGVRDTRILFDRDPNRQGIADIAQLIRAIEDGIDVDGDGTRDLDPEHIYYGGLSKGAVLGVLAATVESRFKASAVSSPGGFIEFQNTVGRRGPVAGLMLQEHVPSLLNPPGTPVITQLGAHDSHAKLSQGPGVPVTAPFFNENMPDRGQPPISSDPNDPNYIPGALEIQDYFERLEWLNANNAAAAFMEYLRTKPINGAAPPILIQVTRGDRTTVNPTVFDAIHAGRLEDRVTLYRHDLLDARDLPSPPNPPGVLVRLQFPDAHTLLISTNSQTFGATAQRLALQEQEQIATFYESDGATTIDPDGTERLFETPAACIPADFGFIIPEPTEIDCR